MAERPIVIAAVILHDPESDKILIGRRMNPEEIDLYGFPGGKQDAFERVEHCARRELLEETNLVAQNMAFLGYVDEFIHDHFLAMMFVCAKFSGELKTMEPNKCRGWEWWDREEALAIPEKTKLFEMVFEAGMLDL